MIQCLPMACTHEHGVYTVPFSNGTYCLRCGAPMGIYSFIPPAEDDPFWLLANRAEFVYALTAVLAARRCER